MSVADVCDIAHAALLEQFEQDGRALLAAGGTEHPPQWFRDELEGILEGDEEPDVSDVDDDLQELRRALGVA